MEHPMIARAGSGSRRLVPAYRVVNFWLDRVLLQYAFVEHGASQLTCMEVDTNVCSPYLMLIVPTVSRQFEISYTSREASTEL